MFSWIVLFGFQNASAYPEEPAKFVPFFSEQDVTVEISREGEANPWIRARGTVDSACEALMGKIARIDDYHKLFSDAVDSVKALDNASDGTRFHIVWGLPFPFRDRDAIVRYSQTDPLTLSWRDAAKDGDPKTAERIEKVAGNTKLSPRSGSQCDVVYSYYGDLGGDLPEFVKQRAWRHEPIYYFSVLRQR